MPNNKIIKTKFQCTGCGQCCTGNPATHYVEVSRAEQKRIISFQGIDDQAFRRRYLETAGDDSEGIKLLESGRCPFLNFEGKCSIYAVRPNQCLSYPFWSDLLSSQENWNKEKKRCEGIGKGPVITEQEVLIRLATHIKT